MSKSNGVAKTNAIRILESESIPYELFEYDISTGHVDGISVAERIGSDVNIVYKTLVTTSGPKELFVFLVPVAAALDLKKAAKAAGVKKLEMLPLKDLTKETGYIRGGCTAVGMKRKYPTFIDRSAEVLEYIIVSAGKPGVQMKLAAKDLSNKTESSFLDLVK